MVDDPALARIKWLVRTVFREVAKDPTGWRTLYKDPDTNDFWEMTFPLGEMHGGGPPTLTRISPAQATEHYTELR